MAEKVLTPEQKAAAKQVGTQKIQAERAEVAAKDLAAMKAEIKKEVEAELKAEKDAAIAEKEKAEKAVKALEAAAAAQKSADKAAQKSVDAAIDAEIANGDIEPKVYQSRRGGLGLTVKAATERWSEKRRVYVPVPGVHIKFRNNRFVATTQEQVDFLDAYCAKKPKQVWPMSRRSDELKAQIAKLQAEEEAHKKVAKQLKETIAAAGGGKVTGGQGAKG